jgi:agmatinase
MPGMQVNRPGEPAYAGINAFMKLPVVLDPADLGGVDVAIVGAPIDEAVSNRPGARYGPRAIRGADVGGGPPASPNMDVGVDPFAVLTVVDYGDAEVIPADKEGSHAAIRKVVGEIAAAGVIPIVLGGDHSIAHPDVGAVADHLADGRTLGLIHFDAHADNADTVAGVKLSHGTPLRRLVEEGSLKGRNILQIGLRGYWPDPEDFEWARGQGFQWWLMDEVGLRGMETVVDEVAAIARTWDAMFLSFDIDVVDPGSAPGTGTPEPGGITPREALRAVRRLATEVGFAGMEVVEVAPPYDHADVTSMLAHRLVLEALSGLALRRLGRDPRPERVNR